MIGDVYAAEELALILDEEDGRLSSVMESDTTRFPLVMCVCNGKPIGIHDIVLTLRLESERADLAERELRDARSRLDAVSAIRAPHRGKMEIRPASDSEFAAYVMGDEWREKNVKFSDLWCIDGKLVDLEDDTEAVAPELMRVLRADVLIPPRIRKRVVSCMKVLLARIKSLKQCLEIADSEEHQRERCAVAERRLAEWRAWARNAAHHLGMSSYMRRNPLPDEQS